MVLRSLLRDGFHGWVACPTSTLPPAREPAAFEPKHEAVVLFRARHSGVTVLSRREICMSAQMRTDNACASFCKPYAGLRPDTRFEACSTRDSPQSLCCRGGTCSPQWVPPPFVNSARA